MRNVQSDIRAVTAKIHAKLEEVAAGLSSDLNEGCWTGKTITLKYKLDTYKGKCRQQVGCLEC